MGKMRAVRYHGQRDLRLDEIDEPTCVPGRVKVFDDFLSREPMTPQEDRCLLLSPVSPLEAHLEGCNELIGNTFTIATTRTATHAVAIF